MWDRGRWIGVWRFLTKSKLYGWKVQHVSDHWQSYPTRRESMKRLEESTAAVRELAEERFLSSKSVPFLFSVICDQERPRESAGKAPTGLFEYTPSMGQLRTRWTSHTFWVMIIGIFDILWRQGRILRWFWWWIWKFDNENTYNGRN